MFRILMVLLLGIPLGCNAKDVVRTIVGESELDRRISYKQEVLAAALEATRATYGDHELRIENSYMNAKRAFHEMALGRAINVYFALTNPHWEQICIPIRIPVRRGLESYRLLLIHKGSLKEFEAVETLEDLKRMRTGLNEGWTSYDVMQSQGFNLVRLSSYDGMFSMLSLRRYDYLLRGVNELYDEMQAREHVSNDFIVAPRLAVYLPSASYIFVSKTEPRLAKRLTEGLQMMVADGSLELLFNKHHAANIAKAELDKRKILYIPNPLLPENIPWEDKRLWLQLPGCGQHKSPNCK